MTILAIVNLFQPPCTRTCSHECPYPSRPTRDRRSSSSQLAARDPPTRSRGMDLSPDLVWTGPSAPMRWPEHGRFSPPSGPRRTRTGVEHGPAEGVPDSRRTLSPAPKRHGADQTVAWADSSSKESAPRARAPHQQLAALAPCEAHRPRRKGRR